MRPLFCVLASAAVLAVAQAPANAQTTPDASSAGGQGNTYKAFRHSSTDDKALAKSVWKHISHMKGLELANVNVVTKDGAVLLTGRVSDLPQIARIGAAVQEVSDVKSVINDLVAWPSSPD